MTQKRHIQIRNSIKRYWVNRKYNDRLFRKIFQDKEDLLQLLIVKLLQLEQIVYIVCLF